MKQETHLLAQKQSEANGTRLPAASKEGESDFDDALDGRRMVVGGRMWWWREEMG